jgi:hypothetical protein
MVSISLDRFRQLKKKTSNPSKNYWQDRDCILRWFGKTEGKASLTPPNHSEKQP